MDQTTNLKNYAKKLGVALEEAVSDALRQRGDLQLALLYSAGIDSALLARICQEVGQAPLLISIGARGSQDLEYLDRPQADLGLLSLRVPITAQDIATALPTVEILLNELGVQPTLKKLKLIHLSLAVGTYLACQAAVQEGISFLLTGEGADSLFAGFDRYQRVDPQDLAATLVQDAQKALQVGLARDQAVVDLFSIQLAAPYLNKEVMELAAEIPIQFKLGPEGNKLVLRELALQRNVPSFIAQRPKKSFQYSSGIWQIVRGLRL
jgi:asparagine synthase (glutamine-hydrolysing)